MSLPPQTSVRPEPTGPTPAQTIGPFFRGAMASLGARDLVAPGSPGPVVLTGRVLDGAGAPLPDAMVEIWQADGHGSLAGAAVASGTWSGFGRSLTDADGRYGFTTVVPGAVDGVQAPHIDMTVFARGLLQRLVTRVYLPDQPANATDPVLTGLDADRRATLLAVAGAARRAPGEPDGDPVLTFDVRLQGERETAFFVW